MTVRGLIDYHLHTNTSCDSNAAVEEYCRGAARLGLREIAITNHMNLRSAEYHVTAGQLCELRAQIDAMRHRHPNVVVRLGVEVDYFEDLETEIEAMLKTYERALGQPLDVVLVGVHVLRGLRMPTENEARSLFELADAAALFREYVSLLTRAVNTGLFDIAAHPDLIKRFTGRHSSPVPFAEYREAAVGLVEALIATGTAMEINVKGLEHPVREIYPSDDLLGMYVRAAERAGKEPVFTLGSDAHAAEALGLHLEDGVRALHRNAIDEIATFQERGRRRLALPDRCCEDLTPEMM